MEEGHTLKTRYVNLKFKGLRNFEIFCMQITKKKYFQNSFNALSNKNKSRIKKQQTKLVNKM